MTVAAGVRRAGLVLVCCVLAAVLAGPAAADDDPQVTVQYQGTIDTTRSDGGPFDAKDNYHLHVEWELVWDVHPPLAQADWRIVKLTGNVSAVFVAPNESASCAGTLSDSLTLPWLRGQYTPSYDAAKRTVQVTAFAPVVLHSSSPATPFAFCGNDQSETTVGSPSPQPHPDPLQPQIDYVPGSGAVSKKFVEDWTEPHVPFEHFVLDSTLTVNGTAQPLPATPPAVRTAAVNALRQQLTLSLYPCLTAASGVVLFGAGGLVLGPIVGTTMVALAGPACAQALTLLSNLQRIYRDPPVAGFRAAAQVARAKPVHVAFKPCRGTVSVVRSCTALHDAGQAWAVSLQRAAESSGALARTIGRESAARAAGDADAVALQQATALDLLPVLQADLRREAAAGRVLAGRLRALGAHGRLTKAQAATAIDRVTAKLAKRGIPTVTLRAVAPAALTPRALDLLGVLG